MSANQNIQTINHVAIICDGNRRWAKSKGWKPFQGHQYAVDNVFEDLITTAVKNNIKFITFWVFSTENWQRESTEVEGLLQLFRVFFDRKINSFDQKGIKFKMIGDSNKFPTDIQEKISAAQEKTKQNATITVSLAMNYGGRDEIIRATKKIAEDVEKGLITSSSINDELFASYLDTDGMPDPEMIVRTSGDYRLSGFLPWQGVYSELFFVETPFPEFNGEKLSAVIEEFSSRQRRFGK